MTRGRKPEPTALKVIKGNPGKRRLIPDRRGAGHLSPDAPPEHLSEAEREIWRQTLEAMPAGILMSVDAELLAAYCIAVVQYRRTAEAARRVPPLQQRGRGSDTVVEETAAARALVRASEAMRKLAGELGLTPTTQSRAARAPVEDEVDQWRQLRVMRPAQSGMRRA